MAIFIVRHGETEGNAAGIVQMPDTPLNERGIQQAERVAKRLAEHGISKIISSDYSRAAMTAQQIHQIDTNVRLEYNGLLRERHFGDLRGCLHSDIGNLYDPDRVPPNGESWQQFHERVDRAWQQITAELESVDGNLAVVTHGLVCYSLALRRLNLPAGEQAGFSIGNTAVTIVEAAPPWSVRTLNCTTHLYDIGVKTMDKQGA